MELVMIIVLLVVVVKMVKFLFADNEIYAVRQDRRGFRVEEPNSFKVFGRGLLRMVIFCILVAFLLSCCSAF